MLPRLLESRRARLLFTEAALSFFNPDLVPHTTAEAYVAAGRAGGRERRRRAAAALAATGVEVLETSPEELPVAVADHYLALKAAGRL